MLTQESRYLMNAFNQANPAVGGIKRTKTLALTAGFFAMSGIIIGVFAIWLYLWKCTSFKEITIFRISSGIMLTTAFYTYTLIRRGFGAFFLFLSLISITTFFSTSEELTIFTTQPFGSITVIINLGLFVYGIVSRSIIGIVTAALFTIAYFFFFRFNPQFITTWFLLCFGAGLILCACIFRYFVRLNTYY